MRNRPGQGLLEYVMLIALIALLMVAALVAFQRTLHDTYEVTGSNVAECIDPDDPGCD